MPVLRTKLNVGSDEFKAAAVQLGAQVAELRERLALVRAGGDAPSRDRHTARGKLLVRDRIERLLDAGAPFLELSPLAA